MSDDDIQAGGPAMTLEEVIATFPAQAIEVARRLVAERDEWHAKAQQRTAFAVVVTDSAEAHIAALRADLSTAEAWLARALEEFNTCRWQHVVCDDCGAMQNFIGQGLYECWKCESRVAWKHFREVKASLAAAQARAEKAEAAARALSQHVHSARPHINERIQDVAAQAGELAGPLATAITDIVLDERACCNAVAGEKIKALTSERDTAVDSLAEARGEVETLKRALAKEGKRAEEAIEALLEAQRRAGDFAGPPELRCVTCPLCGDMAIRGNTEAANAPWSCQRCSVSWTTAALATAPAGPAPTSVPYWSRGGVPLCGGCDSPATVQSARGMLCDRCAASGTVPRPHCNRCDRCGWELQERMLDGCVVGSCSSRPLPIPRLTCAGCGAAFEDAAGKGGGQR